MSTESVKHTLTKAREEFNELIKDIRPHLHRYCSRMTGSVIDAEDIVQDALAKALYAMPITTVNNLQGWLFRIAHNQALDFLRHQNRHSIQSQDDSSSLTYTDSVLEDHELTRMAINVFLELAPLQRSCVILKDVLDHSLIEISEQLEVSVPAIKAALYRGRNRLREIAPTVCHDSISTHLDTDLLALYVERFNNHDFDALRDMLADDVRLDLVGRAKGRGTTEVGNYYHRYSQFTNWHFRCALIESRPCILAFDTESSRHDASFFILIEWHDGKIHLIRDYHHARHVMVDAETTSAGEAT